MALIHLIRHGRSSLTHNGEWIDVAGFDWFVEEYDKAGILADERPSPELIRLCAPAKRIISSSMRRAVETAERIAGGRPIDTTPLVREIGVVLPRIPLRLPMVVWDTMSNVICHASVSTGIDVNGELARSREAATWLLGQAAGSDPLVVVTHGTFRRMMAQALMRRGLRQTAGVNDYRNWSVWTLETQDAR